MIEVRLTHVFSSWLSGLTDELAADRILARLRRIELGNFGDIKQIGDGVSEARIDHGPGYRLYFLRRGKLVVVMLCGGDKSTQRRDITAARKMAKEI